MKNFRSGLLLLFRSFPNRSTVSLQYHHLLGEELVSCRRLQCRKYSGQLYREKPEVSKSWSPFNYALPTGFLLMAGVGFLLHHNDERRAVLKGQGNEHARSPIKGPTFGDSVTLVDTEGRLITKHDLLGNWVLLYFGYTSSPDTGPEEVHKMARVINILESKQSVKIVPVFITIDPERDSPSQLRVYLNEFDPRIVGLTGPISTIRKMAQTFRVYFKKVEEDGDDYLVETPHNMYLLDPDMEMVSCFEVQYTAEQLSEGILTTMMGTSE